MRFSQAVAEIMGYLHVQILPGLLDSFEKISFSRLNLEKRKKRQARALYKKSSQSEQGAFVLGAPKDRAILFSSLLAMKWDHFLQCFA